MVVLRNQNIRNGQLDLSSPSFTDEAGYQSRIKRAVPQPGDIVFTREAPMGEVCMIPEGLKCCLGQRQVLLRPKKSVSGKYLYWALQSPFVQHQISWNEGTGTTVSNVRIPVLKSLQIPRRGIEEPLTAEILSSLADKIELNEQINQTLEQMAQAIFKSWFVDFEPVKSKVAALEADGSEEDVLHATMKAISGKNEAQLTCLQTEQPEQYAKLRATAELFPSAMQDSKLGEIPKGWKVGTLADLANLNKNSWTKRTIPPEIDYVDLANTKNGIIETTTRYASDDAPSRARRKLSDGDTIVGTVRPGNRSFAFLKQPSESLTGSTGFAVLSPKKADFSEFVYLAATSDESISHLAHLADGGAYPAVRPEVVSGLTTIIPTNPVVERFHALARSNFELSTSLKVENLALSRIRDELLPKLLSGEIRAPDVDLLLEEAI